MSIPIPYRFDIDIAKNTNTIESFAIKQDDKDAHEFKITMLEDGNAMDLTGAIAKAYFYKQDKTEVFQNCKITDNLINFILKQQGTTCVGLVKCEIEIIKDNAVITTMTFYYTVTSKVRNDSAIESTSDFSALQDALNTVTVAVKNIATLETLNEILTKNINTGNSLKSELNTSADNANTSKDDLDNSIATSTIKKTELENVIATADTTTYATKGEIYDITKDIKEESTTPEIYNTSSFFQVGKGTYENGDDVGDTYKDSIVNGQVTEVQMTGETWINLFDNSNNYALWLLRGATVDVDGIITLTRGDGIYPKISKEVNLKPNTEYTIILEVLENMERLKLLSNITGSYDTIVDYDEVGLIKTKIKTQDLITDYIFSLYFDTGESTDYVKIKNLMLLEGDWTNKEVHYINGNSPKSTLMSTRFKSISKNLATNELYKMSYSSNAFFIPSSIPIEDCELFNASDKFYYSNDFRGAGNLYNVQGIDTLTLSIRGLVGTNINLMITEYENYNDWLSSNVYLSNNIKPNSNSLTVNLNSQTKYVLIGIGISYNYRNDGGYISWDSIQLEVGNIVTDYEEPQPPRYAYATAYDENGNILEGRSLPNGVKDEVRITEGKAVKRTDKISCLKADTNILTAGNTYRLINGLIDSTKVKDKLSSITLSGYRLSIEGVGEIQEVGNWNDLSANTETENLWWMHTYGEYFEISKKLYDSLIGTELMTLNYQLQNPIYIPCTVKGDFYAYKDGHTEITPYISKEFVYTDNKITLPYAVDGVDILLNKKGEEVEKDNYTLTDDGLSLTIVGATNGDVFMVYAPIRKELNVNGTFSAKYLTGGVKSQVEQLNRGQQSLVEDVMSVQDQVAMIIVTSS